MVSKRSRAVHAAQFIEDVPRGRPPSRCSAPRCTHTRHGIFSRCVERDRLLRRGRQLQRKSTVVAEAVEYTPLAICEPRGGSSRWIEKSRSSGRAAGRRQFNAKFVHASRSAPSPSSTVISCGRPSERFARKGSLRAPGCPGCSRSRSTRTMRGN